MKKIYRRFSHLSQEILLNKFSHQDHFFFIFIFISIFIFTFNFILPTPSFASNQEAKFHKKPLWDLGIGPFIFHMPHYRGSDQGDTYYWPLPDFNYRGKKIQVQNSFVNGNIFQSDPWTVGFSFNGTLRVNSAKNRARAGMPSLDPSLEMGPMVSYDFLKLNNEHFFSFNWPIRQVVAVEFWRVQSIGFFTVPFVAWSYAPQSRSFYSEMTLAVMAADRHYNRYYYGVAPQYANENRRAYAPNGGYSGSHFTWFVSKNLGPFYGFSFMRYDYLKKAVFESGPLFKTPHHFVMGAGLIWYFLKSSETAQ
jgi:outer membrane protein